MANEKQIVAVSAYMGVVTFKSCMNEIKLLVLQSPPTWEL